MSYPFSKSLHVVSFCGVSGLVGLGLLNPVSPEPSPLPVSPFASCGSCDGPFTVQSGNLLVALGGKAGIGTTSPSTTLDVRDNTVSGDRRTILTLRTDESTTYTAGSLDFAQGAGISARITNYFEQSGLHGLSFHTSDGGIHETFRITPWGRSEITDYGSGEREILTLRTSGDSSGHAARLDFKRDATISGRITNYYEASGKQGLSFSTYNSPNLSERMRITAEGNVGIATTSPSSGSKLHVNGNTRTSTLTITGGSDLAEPFEVLGGNASPGFVVSIDPENAGKLRLAKSAYDRMVAGVISGAGGVRPGMTMSQGEASNESSLVALTGRVYVWCDASSGAIQPGDLLTTSSTLGHAMRVADFDRANGAVLGKAMSGLLEGKGLVLMVVTLQ